MSSDLLLVSNHIKILACIYFSVNIKEVRQHFFVAVNVNEIKAICVIAPVVI